MTKRKAIYLDAYGHSQPIPAACRLGNTLVTGIIHGLEPGVQGGVEHGRSFVKRTYHQVAARCVDRSTQ